MSQSTVASRYALAVYELGIETGQLPAITEQLLAFAKTYSESAELRAVLDNPIVERSKRDAILADVATGLGVSGNALSLVRLLASRKKLLALPEIASKLGLLNDEKQGVLRATVTTAGPLPEDFFQKLVAQLESATSRRVLIERHQDPSLIAGVVTRIGDNTIDGSLKGRLVEIERQLSGL